MNAKLALVVAAAVLVPLSGCLGSSTAFKPGTDFTETGRTIHLKMWVVDLTNAPLYPGLNANLWAFCAAAADPGDAVSEAAIEYRDQPGNVPAGSEGKCSVPGPIIRVQQGDKVIVEFQNTHVHAHTIHWHGQYVPNEDDGSPGTTQDSVKPGDSYRYEFIAKRAGTLWYHCHVDTQFHVMEGLYGAFIVEPQDKALEPKGISNDYTLVLGTMKRQLVEAKPAESEPVDPHAAHRAGASCGTTGNQGCQNPPVDVTPDVFLINGRSYPATLNDKRTLLRIDPGASIRVRFVNAGETVEAMHIHGHDFYITHQDGNPVPEAARQYVDTLTIAPGERYDVVIEGNNPGVWLLHTHINSHEANDKESPGGMQTLLVYANHEGELEKYKAELPGGKPYQPTVAIPADFADSSHQSLANGPDSSVQWQFPVAKGCAMQRLKFTVTAQADNVGIQALDNLTVIVKAPDGSVAFTKALGSGDYAEWLEEYPNGHPWPQDGKYSAQVSGRAFATTVDLAVNLHYFASQEDLRTGNAPC